MWSCSRLGIRREGADRELKGGKARKSGGSYLDAHHKLLMKTRCCCYVTAQISGERLSSHCSTAIGSLFCHRDISKAWWISPFTDKCQQSHRRLVPCFMSFKVDNYIKDYKLLNTKSCEWTKIWLCNLFLYFLVQGSHLIFQRNFWFLPYYPEELL